MIQHNLFQDSLSHSHRHSPAVFTQSMHDEAPSAYRDGLGNVNHQHHNEINARQPAQPKTVRINQMILNLKSSQALSLLLPTIAWKTQNNDERWVTWIASDFIDREILEQYSIDGNCLRMLVDNSMTYSPWKLLLTALSNGRSSLVVASLPTLTAEEQVILETAALAGDSQALILLPESTHYVA